MRRINEFMKSNAWKLLSTFGSVSSRKRYSLPFLFNISFGMGCDSEWLDGRVFSCSLFCTSLINNFVCIQHDVKKNIWKFIWNILIFFMFRKNEMVWNNLYRNGNLWPCWSLDLLNKFCYCCCLFRERKIYIFITRNFWKVCMLPNWTLRFQGSLGN